MATDSFPTLVNSSHLYNLILSSSFLVIDVRSADDYEQKHVRTAISLPMQRLLSDAKATSSPLSLGAIDSIIQRHHQNAWKARTRSRIVLYDGNQTSDIHLVTTLARLLRDERPSCAPIAVSEPTPSLATRSVDGPLCSTTPSCSRSVACPVHVLEGGFAAFQSRFPFMCVETPPLLRTSFEQSGATTAGPQGAEKASESDPAPSASSSRSQPACQPPLPPPPIGTKIPVTRKKALPLTTVVCAFPSLQIQENHVYPNEIIEDFLYLGSRDTATDRIVLGQLKITHILNMAGEIENPFQDEFTYLHFNLDDTKMDDVAQYFEQIYDFLGCISFAMNKSMIS
eukprot:CAMPEP_0177677500 /NCGR_PEP_ID=MMETSP0447-20121125/28431_1 /TAXON_ID=0 /ORGANISM="Stygamoeba regulata, Strain BSH-02190019" /LENGTH=340 /DNA_ID=CAMNT_0019186285 /DNA_START=84 /DNA_END=1109 /DNA_ORIENTATION=+